MNIKKIDLEGIILWVVALGIIYLFYPIIKFWFENYMR